MKVACRWHKISEVGEEESWEIGCRMVCEGLRRIWDKNGNYNGTWDRAIDSPGPRTRK